MKLISWPLKIILLLTMMVSGTRLLAQREDINVLLDSLEKITDSTDKVDILNAIAGQCMEDNLDLAIEKAHDARSIGIENGYLYGVANANKWLGKGNALKGKNAESLHNFMDALKVYKELEDSLEMANVYKYLANVYATNDNDREAMRYYIVAMDIYQQMNDIKGQSAILNNIGTIYLSRGKPDSALYYLNQSRLSYLEIKDESGLATNYTNMGYAHAIDGDYSGAIEYYQKSYELAKKLDSKETMATTLNNLGDGYMNLGKYDKAEEMLFASIKIAEEEGLKRSIFVGFYTLGEIKEKKGEYKESLEWFHKAEAIELELRDAETLNALMDVQTMQLEDAQRREIEKINTINEEKLQSEKLKNYLFLSFAIFALIMLLSITYYFMKKHKISLKIAMQNTEISSQKEYIEKQSKKIEQVNSTLRIRNKKLRELNEEKNYMMSVVAHDLKSPLNQINGLANVINLDAKNLNGTQKECLNNIAIASTRLSKMINKILDSSSADKREENLQIEDIDLEVMAGEVLNDFSTSAAHKKIKLNKNTRTKKTVVKADKHYLRQVFDNLVSNAIKFSQNGKTVELNILEDDNKVLVEVKDQGPGLTKEDKEKLFTEYAVLSAKPTGNETSTGLGLAIVKNYVEKMGGKIWCESKHGHGASFKFKLNRA